MFCFQRYVAKWKEYHIHNRLPITVEWFAQNVMNTAGTAKPTAGQVLWRPIQCNKIVHLSRRGEAYMLFSLRLPIQFAMLLLQQRSCQEEHDWPSPQLPILRGDGLHHRVDQKIKDGDQALHANAPCLHE